jgi:hypothetical protein
MRTPIEKAHKVTITLDVPTIVHLIIGAAIAAASLAAFTVHFAMPSTHEYKQTASDVGTLGGCTVLAYWLWCTLQRSRDDHTDAHVYIEAAVHEAENRESRTVAVLQELGGEIRENRSGIKEMHGQLAELLGAVEVLQDYYMKEGQALVFPAIEAPEDEP